MDDKEDNNLHGPGDVFHPDASDNEETSELAQSAPIDEQPPVESTPPAAPTTSIESSKPKKKHSKRLLFVFLVILTLTIFLGGGYAYYQANLSPMAIIRQGIENTLEAESVSFSGGIDVKGEGIEDIISDLQISGSADSDGDAMIKLGINLLVTTVELDVVSVDDKFYIKLSGLKGAGSLLGLAGANNPELTKLVESAINTVNDQWVELDPALLGELGFEASEDSVDQITEDQFNQIKQVFLDNFFVELKEDLGSEDIEGTVSSHYKIGINPEKFKAFLEEVYKLDIPGVQAADEYKDDVDKAIEELGVEGLEFDIWIGDDDKLIHRVSFAYSDENGSAAITLNLTDYNQDVAPAKPESSKTILELIDDLYKSLNIDQNSLPFLPFGVPEPVTETQVQEL